MPQFTTSIDVGDFGALTIHFVHARAVSSKKKAIPLLFLHGWPGSFMEIEKGLPLLLRAGFDVVAPSLPGYGFSSYPKKKGFNLRHHAEVMNKLMLQLGYPEYVIQGGDWGSNIVHAMGILFPDNIQAIHRNMFETRSPQWPEGKEPEYTASEQAHLDRAFTWFRKQNLAYAQIHVQRPLTMGTMLTDSPMGLFTWFADKLITWSDAYPWTFDEMITFTMLHYFAVDGPTTGLVMYHENPEAGFAEYMQEYVKVPCGFSAVPKELMVMPRSWAQMATNCVFYKEHTKGGHFAMWERPEMLVEDMIEFFEMVWKEK